MSTLKFNLKYKSSVSDLTRSELSIIINVSYYIMSQSLSLSPSLPLSLPPSLSLSLSATDTPPIITEADRTVVTKTLTKSISKNDLKKKSARDLHIQVCFTPLTHAPVTPPRSMSTRHTRYVDIQDRRGDSQRPQEDQKSERVFRTQ